MDKKFFRILFNTSDIIVAAFFGAMIGASFNPSKSLISSSTAAFIMLFYFILSIVVRDSWLER